VLFPFFDANEQTPITAPIIATLLETGRVILGQNAETGKYRVRPLRPPYMVPKNAIGETQEAAVSPH
jgi:hypothetical protein